MSNKITCTCGHSWNKSSSSKKDMRICHICGKDNTMKNGGWLDSYDEEMQLGGFVYPTNYVPQAQLGINTGDMASLPGVRKQIPLSKEQLAKNKKEIEVRNAKTVADREARIRASERAQYGPMSAQTLAEQTQATGDKFRLFPNDANNIFDDYVNPGVMIGNMASGIGSVPYNLQQGNYGQAAMSVAAPLLTGALGGIGAKSTGQFVNNLVNPLANTKNQLKKGLAGTKSLLKEVKGEILQGKANRESIKKGNDWLEGWINHPATQQKIDKDIDQLLPSQKYKYDGGQETIISPFTDLSDKAVDSFKKAGFYNIEPDRASVDLLELTRNQSKNYKPDTKEFSLLKQADENLQQYLSKDSKGSIHDGNWGVSYEHIVDPFDKAMYDAGIYEPIDRYGSWVTRSPDLPIDRRVSTTIHEGTHGWVPSKALSQSGLRNVALENMAPNIRKDYLEWRAHHAAGENPAKIMGKERAHQAYLADPTEQHARIMQLRNDFDLKPDMVIDENYANTMMDKIDKGATSIDHRFLNVINRDPKKLANLFNKFWAVPPAVIGAAATQENKNGGYIPQAQNGIEGTMGGFTDQGFNYNGAWGGTMENGGELTPEELASLNKAKMRSKMALAAAFGNPSAIRMTSGSPSSYRFDGNEMINGESAGVRPGETGTHFMASMGEYAVPYIQEGPNGKLQFKSNASFRDKEAIKFDNPKDAEYFAEHYKEVAPMMRQYAMGGSMPGSVGFSYARTGEIPNNGKYAKKTMASAQNGKEMSFYQNGLDWTPRNISKNGSEIPQAQMGTMVTPLDFSKPLGTLEGVSEVMSAPARTATYLLTGKYQDPSQALGIKNPWGALAADMVLDPVNLLGVGVASKMGKLAGKTTKAATKTLAPGKKAIQKGVVYSSELHSNPKFIEKLDEGYVQAKKNIDKFSKVKGALADNESWKFSPEELQKYKIQSDLDDEMRIINGIYPELPISVQKLNPESILFDNMSKMKLEDFASNRTAGTSWSSGKNRYFSKSDMSKFKNEKEFLEDVGKKEYQEFLKEHPKDYKFSMTDLISLPKNKEGGEITKDDNGYWNPENWGKPVEIGSNEITMQGVYEPLLGISDTGDTQMMYPGEDYKFKGKKVTEYPVAEDGYRGSSVVDYLATKGLSSTKSARKELAEQFNVDDYDYSSGKNLELLEKLRNSDAQLNKMKKDYTPISVERLEQMLGVKQNKKSPSPAPSAPKKPINKAMLDLMMMQPSFNPNIESPTLNLADATTVSSEEITPIQTTFGIDPSAWNTSGVNPRSFAPQVDNTPLPQIDTNMIWNTSGDSPRVISPKQQSSSFPGIDPNQIWNTSGVSPRVFDQQGESSSLPTIDFNQAWNTSGNSPRNNNAQQPFSTVPNPLWRSNAAPIPNVPSAPFSTVPNPLWGDNPQVNQPINDVANVVEPATYNPIGIPGLGMDVVNDVVNYVKKGIDYGPSFVKRMTNMFMGDDESTISKPLAFKKQPTNTESNKEEFNESPFDPITTGNIRSDENDTKNRGAGFYHTNEMIDLDKFKFGFHNREGQGSTTDKFNVTKTEGLVIPVFDKEYGYDDKEAIDAGGTKSIRKYKDSEVKENKLYGGIDDKGKFYLDYGKNLKGKNLTMADFRYADVTHFAKDANGNFVLGDETSNNAIAKVPHLVNTEGKEVALNVLIPKHGDDQHLTYGNITGGRFIITTPDMKHKFLASGSLQDLNDTLEEFKKRFKTESARVVFLDNGTFSRGLRKTNKKIYKNDWKKYDNANTRGGAGFYYYKDGGQVKPTAGWLDKYN